MPLFSRTPLAALRVMRGKLLYYISITCSVQNKNKDYLPLKPPLRSKYDHVRIIQVRMILYTPDWLEYNNGIILFEIIFNRYINYVLSAVCGAASEAEYTGAFSIELAVLA